MDNLFNAGIRLRSPCISPVNTVPRGDQIERVWGKRWILYRAKRDLVCFAVVCGQLVCHQVPQSGFAAKIYTAETHSVKKRTKDDGDDDDDDDDDDGRFYIALFSALEQTRCARM